MTVPGAGEEGLTQALLSRDGFFNAPDVRLFLQHGGAGAGRAAAGLALP